RLWLVMAVATWGCLLVGGEAGENGVPVETVAALPQQAGKSAPAPFPQGSAGPGHAGKNGGAAPAGTGAKASGCGTARAGPARDQRVRAGSDGHSQHPDTGGPLAPGRPPAGALAHASAPRKNNPTSNVTVTLPPYLPH